MLRKQELQTGKAPRRRSPPVNSTVIHATPRSMPLNDITHFPHLQVANPSSSMTPTNMTKQSARRNQTFASKVRNGTTHLTPTPNSPVPAPRTLRAHRTGITALQSTRHENISVEKMLFPLIFAALKAILRSLPDSNNMPEVQTLLSMEPLIALTSRGLPVYNDG
ncbi:unnamed protein product [Ixodes hexagonus]